MNNGFIKVASATPKIRVADVEFNTDECIRIASEASASGVKVLLFPELTLTGCTCGDLFFSDKLISGALEGLRRFTYSSAMSDTVYVIGLPLLCGEKLYSCMAVVQSGQILGIIPKTNVTAAEARWFAPSPELNFSYMLDDTPIVLGNKQIFVCRNIPSLKLGIEFCSDLCAPMPTSSELSVAGANIILCPASEKTSACGMQSIDSLALAQSIRLNCGYVIAGSCMGESTTDAVYGGEALICESGEIIAQKAAFGEEILICEIDTQKLVSLKRRSSLFGTKTANEYCEMEFDIFEEQTELTRHIPQNPFIPENKAEARKLFESVLSIQTEGLAKRINAAYAKKIVIGISGGLDSTLAIMVMARAMRALGRPMTDIIAVTMPCFGTTKRTKDNATIICEKLGVDFRCVNIANSVSMHPTRPRFSRRRIPVLG